MSPHPDKWLDSILVCQRLYPQQRVADATFEAVKQRFAEQGLMDLMAVNGYHVLIAVVLKYA